jgi:ABC transporter substrate binding protein (PQQ-dependent alcohol dehydrogenase system)
MNAQPWLGIRLLIADDLEFIVEVNGPDIVGASSLACMLVWSDTFIRKWLFAAHSDRRSRALVWHLEDLGARSLKAPLCSRSSRPFVERRLPMPPDGISTCWLAAALEVHRRLRRLVLGGAPVALVATLLFPSATTAEGAADAAPSAPATVMMVYLDKAYDESPPLSLMQKVLTDDGIEGVRLGIRDDNQTGRFLNTKFVLDEDVVPADGDVVARAKQILAHGPAIIIADLKAADLLAVADLPEAKNAIIFNVRSSDERLRLEDCRANVFHIIPDWAMRADALAQYLIWKKWDRWFVLKGSLSSDQEYVAAIERAAQRFGGKIVEERTYKFETGNARSDTGHQQIQTQMPEATQGAGSYDVVWVADTDQAFGEYVPYRTYDPKPVVGTQGLLAVAWHPAYEEYAGMQLHDAFERFAKRDMTERDYTAWLTARAVGEAATRSGKTDLQALRDYLLSDVFTVAGDKGMGMNFRTWDHQLRQPILIAGPRDVVSISPQEGFLHPKFLTDTLGYVSPDDRCTVATSESTSMAHVIDNASMKLIANVLVDTRPREAQFTADGSQVWVSSEVGGAIAVIDTKTWKIIKKIKFEVPGVRPELLQPVGMLFSKDGNLLFAALGPANRVAVIDTKTYAVKQYILVGQRPWHMALDPDGTKLYVANGLTNDVTVVDVETLKAEKSVPVGRLPWGVAVMP